MRAAMLPSITIKFLLPLVFTPAAGVDIQHATAVRFTDHCSGFWRTPSDLTYTHAPNCALQWISKTPSDLSYTRARDCADIMAEPCGCCKDNAAGNVAHQQEFTCDCVDEGAACCHHGSARFNDECQTTGLHNVTHCANQIAGGGQDITPGRARQRSRKQPGQHEKCTTSCMYHQYTWQAPLSRQALIETLPTQFTVFHLKHTHQTDQQKAMDHTNLKHISRHPLRPHIPCNRNHAYL